MHATLFSVRHIQCFSFFMECTEVHAYLVVKYFFRVDSILLLLKIFF